MMKCRSKSRRSIGLIAAGVALSPAQKEEAAQHLAACALCRADRDRWERLAGELREIPREAPEDAQAIARVEARWRQSLSRQGGGKECHEGSFPLWPSLASLCAAVLMALAFFAPKPHPSKPREVAADPPPTLWAYHRAASRSDQAFNALLERHANTLLPPDTNRSETTLFFDPSSSF